MPDSKSTRQPPVRLAEVFEACDALKADGQRVTADAALAWVGRGSKGTFVRDVEIWRSLETARAVAPQIPVPVLQGLNTWFADIHAEVARKGEEQIEEYRVQAVALQQRLEAETASRTVAAEAADSLRAQVAQQDRELARLKAELAAEKAKVEEAKATSMDALARHAAEASRMRADLDAANAARDAAIAATAAAVKAEGDRVSAQMQSQIDRAMLAQDESRRRAEAAIADARKATEALTAAQVELAKAQAETVRIQQVGQQLYDQIMGRAQQAERELEMLRTGGGPRVLEDLTVRAGKVVEQLASQFDALDVSNKDIVDFSLAAGALSPIEAYSALLTVPEEVLRRRGTSVGELVG